MDTAPAEPAQFSPGTEIRYTNTNYIVAGLLLEAVTGTPAADAVTRLVITPLGLTGPDDGYRRPF